MSNKTYPGLASEPGERAPGGSIGSSARATPWPLCWLGCLPPFFSSSFFIHFISSK
jgi:hypothetical protein